MMRTSPRWMCTIHGLLQVAIRPQLGCHVHLVFSRHPVTVSVISPSYDVETGRSRMRWNRDDDAVVLVLVLAPECSWIMLCDHERCCDTCFGPKWLCIVSGLKPKLGATLPGHASTLGRPRLYLFSSRRHFRLGFCLV